MKKSDQTVLFFEKPIFSKDKQSLLKLVESKAYRTKKPVVLFTPNPEQLVLAYKNPHFSRLLDRADVLIPDGIGLVVASQLFELTGQSERILERISGVDIVVELLRLTSREEWKALLIGGRGYDQANTRGVNVSADLQKALSAQLHWLEGYKNSAHPTKTEEQKIATTLRELKPKVVFVALGAPQQEQWAIDHLALLEKSGVKIVMVVGGAFDILFGKLRRAPMWMRSLGLEWLYRLIQEPHRWRRQLALLEFAGMTIAETLKPHVKK